MSNGSTHVVEVRAPYFVSKWLLRSPHFIMCPFSYLWDGSMFRGIKISTGFNISFFLGGNNTRPDNPDHHWPTSISFVMAPFQPTPSFL